MSRPLRARGLKLSFHYGKFQRPGVAPFTGAWIETTKSYLIGINGHRRALYGRVD